MGSTVRSKLVELLSLIVSSALDDRRDRGGMRRARWIERIERLEGKMRKRGGGLSRAGGLGIRDRKRERDEESWSSGMRLRLRGRFEQQRDLSNIEISEKKKHCERCGEGLPECCAFSASS